MAAFRSRITISYRGIYQSFEQARKSIPATAQDYDNANRISSEYKTQERKVTECSFRNHDYPLLFWLSKVLNKATGVIELGGSIGQFYYSAKRLVDFPENFQWQIAELPEAVSLGTELAHGCNEKQLSFIDSGQIANSAPANIFISSGAIQYINQNLVDILVSLPSMPEYILIHDLPVHSKQSFWTTQRLEYCEVAYHVYFLDKFLEDLKKLGFELIAQWDWLRPMEIPFHKEFNLKSLQGFYFKKTS